MELTKLQKNDKTTTSKDVKLEENNNLVEYQQVYRWRNIIGLTYLHLVAMQGIFQIHLMFSYWTFFYSK